MPVTQCKPSYCLRSETVKVPPAGGYLSAAKPQSTGGGGGGSNEGHCGTLNCPWTLEANPGQRINLTLLDFSADLIKIPDGIPPGAPAGSICYRYASVRDGNLTKDLTGCGKEGQGMRGGRRSVYLSESHVVQITIYTSHTNNVHFLIRYQSKQMVLMHMDFSLTHSSWSLPVCLSASICLTGSLYSFQSLVSVSISVYVSVCLSLCHCHYMS